MPREQPAARISVYYPRLALALLSISLLLALPLSALAAGPGFPNTPQTPGELLSGPLAESQGRTAVIVYHQGFLITTPESPGSSPGSDLLSRVWDISDPRNPSARVIAGMQQDTYIAAHGYYNEGAVIRGWNRDFTVVGNDVLPIDDPPGIPFFYPRNNPELPWFNRGLMFQPFQTMMWWSYGNTDLLGALFKGDAQLSIWDQIAETGVIGHPFLVGNVLYILSDQSQTGIAAYDIGPSLQSPGAQPRLLGVLKAAVGGYWPEIWGGDGRLLALFPARQNGRFFVADITDPSDMKVLADRQLPGGDPQYAQFQDGYAFMERYKIDMRGNFEAVLTLDAVGQRIDTSQFALPIGNLVATGGYPQSDDLRQGLAIWAHQAAPDTLGPSVGFHIPRPDQTSYPLGAPISLLIHETLQTDTIVNGSSIAVRPLGAGGAPGPAIDGRIVFTFDDILQFTPSQDLAPNTTYEVSLPAGGIKDAVGNGMQGYSFRFSTGSTLGEGNDAPRITALAPSRIPAAANQSVTFSYQASDADGDAISYKLDFGDGTPDTGWISATSAAHSFARDGHFKVILQARDPAGSTSTRQLSMTIASVPAGTRPANSSTIAHDASRDLTWSVNPDNDSVARISQGVSQEISLGTGSHPVNVALDSGGNAWVTLRGTDGIAVLTPSGNIETMIALDYGSAPHGIAITPDGSAALVSLYGKGELELLSTSSRAVTATLALGPTPRAIAISGDSSRALVTRFISAEGSGTVWDVALPDLTLTREIPLLLDVNSTDSSSAGRGLPNYLAGIAIDPRRNRAWVAAKLDNIERGLFVKGTDLNQENTVRAIVCEIDLSSNQEILAARKDIDNADSPSSITFSPLADYAFVTLQGSNLVALYDNLRESESEGEIVPVIARIGTGRAPQGAVFDASGSRLLVQDFMSRQVSALDLGALFAGTSSSASVTSIGTIGAEALSSSVLAGKRVFYNAADREGPLGRNRMSGEGYISCASCHIDGGHDGRTWDFTGRGEGLRNTTDLRGRRGTGHGFVHWSANFDEIQDFENDIRNSFGGAGFMSDSDFAARSEPLGAAKAGLSQDLDDLAAYVSSLDKLSLPRSPFRNSDGSKTAAALRGQAVFAAQACDTCHGGASFTESGLGQVVLRDVGTLSSSSGLRLGQALSGIDTPTLLSAASSAPYLHDGSAATLEAVFEQAGSLILQAETATLIGGAAAQDPSLGGSYHGGQIVGFSAESDVLRWWSVDGGPAGGLARISLRYSSLYGDRDGRIAVNGQEQLVTFPRTTNSPEFFATGFSSLSLEVNLAPGATNTIEFRPLLSFGASQVFIDELSVSNAAKLAAASAHRSVTQLSSADRNDLLRYLRELDGSDDQGPLAPDPQPPTVTPSPPATPPPSATPSATSTPGNGGQDDTCPSDPSKQAPGACGCGVPDSDLDSDGVVDCLESMPRPRLKLGKKKKLTIRMASGPGSYEVEIRRKRPPRSVDRSSRQSSLTVKLVPGRWTVRYRGCFGEGSARVCTALSAPAGVTVR